MHKADTVEELEHRLDALEAAIADLEAVGTEHDIPAIRTEALRLADINRIIRTMIPAGRANRTDTSPPSMELSDRE